MGGVGGGWFVGGLERFGIHGLEDVLPHLDNARLIGKNTVAVSGDDGVVEIHQLIGSFFIREGIQAMICGPLKTKKVVTDGISQNDATASG